MLFLVLVLKNVCSALVVFDKLKYLKLFLSTFVLHSILFLDLNESLFTQSKSKKLKATRYCRYVIKNLRNLDGSRQSAKTKVSEAQWLHSNV